MPESLRLSTFLVLVLLLLNGHTLSEELNDNTPATSVFHEWVLHKSSSGQLLAWMGRRSNHLPRTAWQHLAVSGGVQSTDARTHGTPARTVSVWTRQATDPKAAVFEQKAALLLPTPILWRLVTIHLPSARRTEG
jgi:hypothetical protein